MKWVRFQQGEKARYGFVEGDNIQPVDGSPFSQWQRTGERLKLDALQLLVPVVPGSFYAQGRNYEDHLQQLASEFAEKYPRSSRPDPSQRSNNALLAHGESIVIPSDAPPDTHPEGELVAVIGKLTKGVSEEVALSHVLGYTIGNDIGQRTWLKTDNMLWRSKNSDTFKPMGPWIETDVSLPDLVTKVRLNGQLVLEHRTNTMIFGVARVIASISQYVTLHPGDVIWMGAEGNVPPIDHGDVVEIEITGIGTLRNPVVRAGR